MSEEGQAAVEQSVGSPRPAQGRRGQGSAWRVCACLRLEEARAKLRSGVWGWIAGLQEGGVVGNIARGVFPTPVSEGWCHMGL